MDVNVDFMAADSWGPEMPERVDWLRENDPVHWSEKSNLWVLTRYEDLSYVSKHQERFTSEFGVLPGNPAKLGLIDEAEPRHGNLRKLINKGFSPRMVGKLELVFRDIVSETIDAFAKKGACDFVEDFAVPVPLLLIASMIGIRREDFARFHRWSDTMIAAQGYMDDPEITAKAGRAFVEYATYVTEIIEDRRANPQDDLVSILTGAKDQGLLKEFETPELRGAFRERTEEEVELGNDELIKLLVILLVAGNETTRNGISAGMQLLIENPGERQKLIDDPSLIPGACEEMVRLASPVRSFSRTVVEDTELRGHQLLKGQEVLMVYGAANRDPAQYDDPEIFRVDRNPVHLGFGIGNHFCLGANLARMELRVSFAELLQRLPDMEFSDGGPVMRPSPLVRTCLHMNVRFTPEA